MWMIGLGEGRTKTNGKMMVSSVNQFLREGKEEGLFTDTLKLVGENLLANGEFNLGTGGG